VSQENVEVIRRMYERWVENDDALYDAFDPDIELHPDPSADWVGVNAVYRGHDGMRDYMRHVYEAFEDYRPEVEELIDAGDKVITLAIEHGRRQGARRDRPGEPDRACVDDAGQQGGPGRPLPGSRRGARRRRGSLSGQAPAAIASMFLVTTSTVLRSSVVGLNSTTSVPA
jgi:ketosteroid isomerase-like protein